MPWYQVTLSIEDRLVVETFVSGGSRAENRKKAQEHARRHVDTGSFSADALQLEDCTELPEDELTDYTPVEGRII